MLRIVPVLLALLAAGCREQSQLGETRNITPDLDFPVGHFSLTERSGKTVTDQDLRGSVWIASFIFTRCMGPCPQVTATIARLQEELKDVGGVKFVTFTVDPVHDNTKKLQEYARHFNADPDRWLFLTGDEATVHKLIKEAFKQAVEKKSGEDAKPGDEFGHSTRILLIDRIGTIRSSYEGLANDKLPDGKEHFEKGLQSLKERVKQLVKE